MSALAKEPFQGGTSDGKASTVASAAHETAGRRLFDLDKRIYDFALAAAMLLFCFPILAVVAVAIRLDSAGPVLFRQCRTGREGKIFKIYKFRTMHVMEDGHAVLGAARDDPRVTRIGRILRQTSIDELPQLFNVVRGEMSLVGPRPHAVAHDVYFRQHIRGYNRRFEVRPGITGWAQVNKSRGTISCSEDMERRFALDIWYIQNKNLWLDIRICFITLYSEVFGKTDAY